MRLLRRLAAAFAAASLALGAQAASAEANRITIADQFGMAFLPIMVMQERHLLEKHALELGLGQVEVNWAKFGGAGMMNDALLSGSIDIATIGTPGLVLIWDKTRGSRNEVKGIAAINSSPMYLNTRDPNVHTLKDFTSNDKIALPAVKSSFQAIALEMAAAKEFGVKNYDKLDPLTVSMKHPDAMASLLSNKGDITTHFASPPFMYHELKAPGVRRILSTRQISGDVSFVVAYTSTQFYQANPKLTTAFLLALEDAIAQIQADRKSAAATYVRMNGSAEGDLPTLTQLLSDPDMDYSIVPKGIASIAGFMHSVGKIKTLPSSWKDLFFPLIHSRDGS